MSNRWCYRHLRGACRVVALLIVICAVTVSQSAGADHPVYGPPLEIGLGVSGLRMQSRPDWTSKYYGTGIITGAYRIFHGLSIQAGMDYSYGEEPDPEWIDYGENTRLWTHKGTYGETIFYGLRYEIPTGGFDTDIISIPFLCVSLGMVKTEYGIRSKRLEVNRAVEEQENLTNYRTADVSGPYVSLGARWRFDTVDSQETQSWFGAYGLDIGVRYIRYNKSSMAYDNVMEPKSHFNSYQIYMIGFMKIKFLY